MVFVNEIGAIVHDRVHRVDGAQQQANGGQRGGAVAADDGAQPEQVAATWVGVRVKV